MWLTHFMVKHRAINVLKFPSQLDFGATHVMKYAFCVC